MAQEDRLPILQHTLLWMWIQEEERQQREGPDRGGHIRLSLADYEELQAGREVKNALSRHGDKILDGMSAEERRVAEVMFGAWSRSRSTAAACDGPPGAARSPSWARFRWMSCSAWSMRSAPRMPRSSSPAGSALPTIPRSTSHTRVLIRQWATLDRWVRREKASYEVYSDLCRAAQRVREGKGTLLTGLGLSRAQHWLFEEQRTRLWARRYGGDFNAAISFLTDSEEAEAQRLRERQELEDAARRQDEERRRLQNELEQQALRTRLQEQTNLARERRRLMRWMAAVAVVAGMAAWPRRGFGRRARRRPRFRQRRSGPGCGCGGILCGQTTSKPCGN